MTGAELKYIRHHLGLSTTQLGRAFGYVGSDVSVSGTIRKYESEQRALPPWLARLVIMYKNHGVPAGWEKLQMPTMNEIDIANRKDDEHE